MNELLFFLQIIVIAIFSFGALKLGKEALTAWVVIQAMIANLFVLKQINLFGLEVTAGDAFIIGSILGLNFLQERFSQDDATRTTKITFFFLLFFALISQLHLLYIPSPNDMAGPAFSVILQPSPRLFLASTAVFFIVSQIEIQLFALLKRALPTASFALRSVISLAFSQALDTVLFSFAGLYGIVASVLDIIVMSFAIKCLIIFCLSSFTKYVKP